MGEPDADERQRILDATLAELTVKRIASLTLQGVAVRAGVDEQTIRQMWPNAPELVSAALWEFGEQHMPIPDSGTLRGDLLGFARSYAKTANSPIGRRVLNAVIVKPEDWELTGARAVFLEGRVGRFDAIVHRGIARGECPPGTDPVLTIDLLAIGLLLPVLYYDKPITDEHCVHVVETLLHGIATNR